MKKRRKLNDNNEEVSLSRDRMYALRYERNHVTNMDEIVKVAERSYADLYASNTKSGSSIESSSWVGQAPRITKRDVEKALKGMKRGKVAGDHGITVDLLKDGGDILLKSLQNYSQYASEL